MPSALRRLAAVLATASLLACGGGSSTATSSGASADTGTGGGGTSAGGGGSNGGGSGSGAPTGGGGASGGSGGTAGGGSGSSGGGDSGTGSPGDGGGTASADPCSGLVPTFGAPSELQFPSTYPEFATADAHGRLAIGFGGPYGVWWAALYEADGSAVAGGATLHSILPRGGRPLGTFFHPTGGGWRAITHESLREVRTWDALGTPLALYSDLSATEIAPDGQGGSVVLGFDNLSSSSWHLAWLDAGGRAVAGAFLDDAPGAVLVQWGTGHVLVVAQGAGARARWYDAHGGALTGWFSTGVNAPAGSFLRGLLDGTLVLSDGDAWVAAFADGSTQVSPPPSWLRDRPGTYLAVRPNGKGYVMFEARGGHAPAAEVVTPSGQSCGFLAPPGPRVASPSRSAIAWSLGEDGTFLILEGLADPASDGSSAHSAVRWWPALLQ